MLHHEAMTLLDWMRKLWHTTWEPSDAEIDEWVRVFEPISYYSAQNAVRAAWKRKNFGRPVPHAVLAMLHAQTERTATPAQSEADPNAKDTWIICVADGHACRIGTYHQVIVPSGSPSTEQVHAAAHEMSRQHAELYGGTWEVYVEASARDVLYQSRIMRGLPMDPDMLPHPRRQTPSDRLPIADVLRQAGASVQ